MRNKFAVIGLGRFGTTVALELARAGHEVLAVDRERRRVDAVADSVTHAVIADAEDERALQELGLADYDAVLVAIGENIEANIMCTLVLKNQGVKQVWSKAISHNHHKILARVGADRIVHPEFEMGLRVARSLTYPLMADYLSLGHEQFLVEARVSPRVFGKTLNQLDYEGRLQLQVLSLKRKRELFSPPPRDLPLEEDDLLLFIGRLPNLRLLSAEL